MHTHIQATRGKKAKLKRIKDKYGNQDEEDKQIALELLGHVKPKLQHNNSDSDSDGGHENIDNKSRKIGGSSSNKKKDKDKSKEKMTSALLELKDDTAAAMQALPDEVTDA
jgi:hypothetical protein